MKKGTISKMHNEPVKKENQFCTLDIPLERLRSLLDWEDEKNRPAVPYAVLSANYEGRIEEDNCFFHAVITIESYTEKWTTIPVLQKEGIVKKAECKGGQGSIGYSSKGFCLTASREGTYVVELDFYLPFTSKERKNGVLLYSYGSGELNLTIPQPNLSCTLLPALGVRITESEESTLVNAYCGPGNINIGWMPRSFEVVQKEQTPIIHGEVETSVIIGEALIRCKSRINYAIYQAGVISFSFRVLDARVMSVTGEGIRTYDITGEEDTEGMEGIEGADKAQIVKVYLDYETASSFYCQVHYEKKMEKSSMVCTVPVIQLLEVDRESGHLAIASKTNVEITSRQTGNLTSVDIQELPGGMRERSELSPVFAFKYLKAPYVLELDIKKHDELPVLICIADAAVFATTITREGKIITKMRMKVRNNSKQFINVTLPPGSSCLSSFVDSEAVKPARGDNDEVMLPLPKLAGDETRESLIIELVWICEMEKLTSRGKIRLDMGKIDIPISKLGWKICLPDEYVYKNFKGNVIAKEQLTVTIPEPVPQVQPVAFAGIGGGGAPNFAQTQYAMDEPMVEQMMESAVPPPLETAAPAFFKGGKNFFSGSLPVKVEIPEAGTVFYYEKLFTRDEEILLEFVYKKRRRFFKDKKEVAPL